MATITVNSDGGADHTSISSAIGAASDGDEIQVLNSKTYQPNDVAIRISLDITAAPGQTPIIDGTTANGAGNPVFKNAAASCVLTFTGFTFQNFGASSSSNKIVTAGNDITVQYTQCTFKDIDVNIFHDPAAASSGTPNKLDRCRVLRTSTKSLFTEQPGGDWHFLIQNSVLHYAGTDIRQIYIDAGNNNHVNGIVRNCSLLVEVTDNTGTTNGVIRCGTIENVIIRNAATVGNFNTVAALKAKTAYSNNCIFGNFAVGQVNTGASTTGLVTSNPLFVNEGAEPPDLQLQTGSPCIATGKTIPAVTVDFEGTSRSGIPYDIGAFQIIPLTFTADGSETFSKKFGPNSFLIHGTANKLATRGFNNAKDNRQAPFSVTVAGPPTIRERTTPYKNET